MPHFTGTTKEILYRNTLLLYFSSRETARPRGPFPLPRHAQGGRGAAGASAQQGQDAAGQGDKAQGKGTLYVDYSILRFSLVLTINRHCVQRYMNRINPT